MKQLLKKHKFLVISLLVTTLLFAIFFPKFYTTTDEHDYIQNAYYLTKGTIIMDDPQCFDGAYCGYFNEQGYVSKYNLGLSFIYAPFVLIHWKLAFVVNFAFFLLGIVIFYKLLGHFKIQKFFILFYAFFPAYIYYSHKALTEIPSQTIIIAIFYLFVLIKEARIKNLELRNANSKSKMKNALSNYEIRITRELVFVGIFGILSGILIFVKYTNAIFILPFWISLFIDLIKSFEKIKLRNFLISSCFILPFAFIIIYLNQKYYGGIFKSGYSFSGEELLVQSNLIIPQAIKYFLYLNLLFPGMLVLSFFSKIKFKWEILSAFILFFIYIVGFPTYHFESGVLNLIFGIRLFVPIIGLIMLLYFETVNRLIRGKVNLAYRQAGWLIYSVAFMFILNAFAMNYFFQKRLVDLKNQSDTIYALTKEGGIFYTTDIEDRKLVNEAFGKGKVFVKVVE